MNTYREHIAETAEKLAGHPILPDIARLLEAWILCQRESWKPDRYQDGPTETQWLHQVAQALVNVNTSFGVSERLADALGLEEA